jgi:hypothetical protein
MSNWYHFTANGKVMPFIVFIPIEKHDIKPAYRSLLAIAHAEKSRETVCLMAISQY